MILITSFISRTSLTRIVLASLLLNPLLACRSQIDYEKKASTTSAPHSEAPQSAFDFINSIGVNTHLNYFDRIYGNFSLVTSELKSIGILHLRDGIHLQNADYNSALYGRWEALGDLGIRFDAVFDPRSNLGPLNSALLDEIETLSGRTIESIEGPNEMDISEESDWPSIDRTYQGELYTAVRSIKGLNSIRVLGPSLAFASNSSKIGDLSGQLDNGNLHPYPAGKIPSTVFPDQIDLGKIVCDSKGIVFTESGYHNAINEHNDQPGVSEAAAAKYIPRLFLEDFAHGVSRTYLYEFMDEAPEPGLTNPQMHWGLIRANGSEKAAFIALKNLIAELNDKTKTADLQPLAWSISPDDAQIHHVLLQKSDGTYDLVLWQEVSSYDLQRHTDINNSALSAAITLERAAHNITIYDPVTQAEPVHTWNDVKSVPLEIPDYPIVVELSF
jgi:hypothetical protein